MSIDSARDRPVLSVDQVSSAIEAGAEVLLDAVEESSLSCHELALRVFLEIVAKLPTPVVEENIVSVFVGRLDA